MEAGPTQLQTRAAWALGGVALAEATVTVVLGFASDLTWFDIVDLLVFSNSVIGFSMAAAGWPIARQRPANPIGWLLLVGGCFWAWTGAGVVLLAWVADHGWVNPIWRAVATFTNGIGWAQTLMVFLPLTLLLFPDGRYLSRRWRIVTPVVVANGVLIGVLGIIMPRGLTAEPSVGVQGYLQVDNPALLDPLGLVTALLAIVTYLAVMTSVLLRYRRARDLERQQVAWPVLAMLVVITSFVLDPVLPDSVVFLLLIALIPLSMMLGIIRYQLFDVRLVFARSLLYLLLTGAVVGTYVVLVAGLDKLVRTQVSLSSSLVATLVIALAFNPVRVVLQRAVDRAIYGARQDPVRALEQVSARLGEVGVPQGSGLQGVVEALGQVLKLPSVSLVLADREVASYGGPAAASHQVPLIQGNERVGELVIGLRAGEVRMGAADERMLALLAAPIAVAVHAGMLADEVARSRERVIQSREEERRRLRRDLHDGLGPILTGVVLNSEAALRLVQTDPERSAELLAILRDQTTSALHDIRRIVYDLRPPALDSLGLSGALREYAMVLTHRIDGQPLTVVIDADDDLQLPAAVEVATYRIVTEALTNVTRHSNASQARVMIRTHTAELAVSVHDDGVNVGTGWSPGVGLTSIRERAAELGGSCTIVTDRTGGRVDVRLPVARSANVASSASAAVMQEVDG
jgi:two-component system NarL family sensor kinase